jgi:RES domain-containing protein
LRLWRIADARFATLDGMGGMFAAGRWHTRGHRIVYTAESVAGATLEKVVHFEIDAEDMPAQRLIRIEVPDRIALPDVTALPADWQLDLAATRAIGDRWLESGASALLHVPCAIAPHTWNVLINPQHIDATGITLFAEDYAFDARLLPARP